MLSRAEYYSFVLLALCSFVAPQLGGNGQSHGGSPGAGANHGGSLGGASHGGSPSGGNKGSGSPFGGSGSSNPLSGLGGLGSQQPKQGGSSPFGGSQQPKAGGSNPLGGFGGSQQPKQGGSNPLGGFGGNQQPKQGGNNPLGGLLGGNNPFGGGNTQPKPGNQPADNPRGNPFNNQPRPGSTRPEPPRPTITQTRPAPTQQPRPPVNNQPRPTGNWGSVPKNQPPPKKPQGPPPPRPDDRPPWQGRPNEPHRGGEPHRGEDRDRPWNTPRGGDRPYRTTIITGGPTIIKPTVTQWRDNGARTIYNQWDNNWNYVPQIILPPLPRITLTFSAAPRPGCSLAPTTYWTSTETLATFTSTITQPPPDAVVTVYYDPNYNEYSTYYGDEIETVYEVYVFTTTAQVEVISSTLACGGWWKEKRTAADGSVAANC